jgi:hypothetical protein
LEERSDGKGKLAEASEEGQGSRRAVEPMMMMMIHIIYRTLSPPVPILRIQNVAFKMYFKVIILITT